MAGLYASVPVGEVAPKASKQAVVESLLLACQHSGVIQFITPEALRTVLELEYADLIGTGSFDLQAVWELLEEQPRFDAEAVGPPMAAFKSWEERLGVPVELPLALRSLSAGERAELAARCPVPAGRVSRVIADVADAEKIAARDAERRAAAREAAATGMAVPVAGPPRGRLGAWMAKHRGTVIGVSALLGVAGFGVAGVATLKACSPSGEWTQVAADFGDLPVSDPRKLGSQVGVRLTDPGWLELPRERREKQLVAALDRLGPQQVTVLFVTDDRGEVRASVQRHGGRKPRVEVRFR
jgi:hypothetical protein